MPVKKRPQPPATKVRPRDVDGDSNTPPTAKQEDSATGPKSGATRAKGTPPGLPYRADWWDPTLYPLPGCDDRLHLAWEFLRRNADYAKHVQQMLALPPGEYETRLTIKNDASLDGQVCWPPALPGEHVRAYCLRTKKESRTGTRGRIAPPHKTFLNHWALEKPISVDTKYDGRRIKFVPPKVLTAPRVALRSRPVRLMFFANEIALRFRLDIPARAQAEAVANILNRAALRFKKVIGESSDASKKGIRPHVSNSLARETGVMEVAHLWLRAYDADAEPKVPMVLEEAGPAGSSKYKNRRRTLVSGPARVLEKFAEEKLLKPDGSKFNADDVQTFRDAAASYVDDVKYLTLLMPPAKTRQRREASAR